MSFGHYNQVAATAARAIRVLLIAVIVPKPPQPHPPPPTPTPLTTALAAHPFKTTQTRFFQELNEMIFLI